ncbi:MAG: right-handed parallel beta-helix repeat-containing protein, partial [Candidatus Moraniibacteriota bacterium]
MKFVTRFVRRSAFAFLHKSFNVLVIFAFILQPFGATGFNIRVFAADETVVTTAADVPAEAATPKEEKVAPVEEKKTVVEEKTAAPSTEEVVPTEPVAVTAQTAAVAPVVSSVSEETIPASDTTKPVDAPVLTDTPTLTEQPALGAITPEAAAIVAPEAVLSETPTPAKETWSTKGHQSMTNDPVELGKTYVAPQNDQVTVTFTKLPENPGKLSIEELTLTDEQAASLHALSNKAYDITSDMADGTFAYDLTLPKSADQKNVQIKYAENEAGLQNADTVPKSAVKTGNDSVSASLDHFTIFVVVDPTGLTGGVCVDVVGANPAADKCFNTIQEAVNAAATSDGTDTINVAAGTYAGNVTISTPLILQGVNGANLTGSITVASDGVTVDGMNITNPTVGYGIVISGKSNVSITGNTIHDIGTSLTSGSAQAIDLVGGLSAAISGVSITGNNISNIGSPMLAYGSSGSAKGIFIGDTAGTGTITGLTISNNNISNVFASTTPWAGSSKLGRGAYGVLINFGKIVSGSPTASTAATISGNTISNLSGYWAHAIGLEGNTPSTTVSGNTVTGLSDNKGGTDEVAVRLEDNASAGTVIIGSGNTLDGKSATNANSTVIVDLSLASYMSYTGAEVLVNGAYRYIGMNAFATVQGGVDGVSTDGTVNVAAGTYNEKLNITKSVTLVGDGTLAAQGAGVNAPIIDGVDGINPATTTINSDTTPITVVIRNLNIAHGGSGVDVLQNAAVTVDKNTITSYYKNGITFGPNSLPGSGGVSGTISNNIVTGSGLVAVAQNGIQISEGNTATISNNEVSNNLCNAASCGADWYLTTQASGISLVGAAGTVTISGNTVENNDIGIYNELASGASSLLNNIVKNNRYFGFLFEAGGSTVSGGLVSGSPYAIFNPREHSLGVIAVHNVDLSGTTAAVVNDAEFYSLDVTKNYWGSTTGPIINTDIQGAGVANVSFDPWYVNSGKTILSSEISGGDTVTAPNGAVDVELPSGALGEADLPAGVTDVVLDNDSGLDLSAGLQDNAVTLQSGIAGADVVLTNSDLSGVSASIPDGTLITGPTGWDGIITPPTSGTPAGDAPAGFAVGGTVISIGSPDGTLTFDTAVTIVLPGVTGAVGYRPSGSTVWQEITNVCTGTYENPTGAVYPGECAINNGTDTKILTFHFTSFGDLEDTAAPTVPVLLTPGNNAYLTTHDFTFSWDTVTDPSSPVSYEWEFSYGATVKGDGSFTSRSGFHSLASASVYSPGTPDNIYYWHVRAIDSLGNASAWSSAWKVTVDTVAPATPTHVSPADGTYTTTANLIKADWSDVTDSSTPVSYFYQSSHSTALHLDGSFVSPAYTSGALSASEIPTPGTPAGIYYWHVRAVDAAGNTSAWSDAWQFTVDNTAPTKPVFTAPTNNLFTNVNFVTLMWSNGDDTGTTQSGIKGHTIRYAFVPMGGGATIPWTSGLIASGNPKTHSGTYGHGQGTYTLYVSTTDNAGNVSAESNPLVLNYDATAPNTPLLNTPSDGFVTKGVAFTQKWFAVSDAVLYEYQSCNTDPGDTGDSCGSVKWTQSFTGLTKSVGAGQPDSQFWWRVRAKDAAGNWSGWSESRELKIDNTAPVTTDSGTDADWHNSDVTVTLSCDDGTGSGCNKTYYTTDGSNPTSSSNEGNTVVVSSEGTTTIKYLSVDNAGNAEIVKTAGESVRIDKTNPESVITFPINTATNQTVITNSWDGSIAGTAADTTSSVDHVALSIERSSDGKFWNDSNWVSGTEVGTRVTSIGTTNWTYAIIQTLAEDTYTITSHAVDAAGNIENSYVITVILDKTIPEVTLTIDPANPNGDNNWYATDPTITLAANDNFNIDRIQYQLNSTGGSWTTYAAPVTLADGVWQFYYRSIDTASNASSIGLKNVKVDTVDPDNVDHLDATYRQLPNRVQLTWDVNDSDIDSVYIYRGKSKNFSVNTISRIAKNNRNDTNYSDDNVTPGEKYYYKVVTIDNAGNKSNVNSLSIALPTEGTQAVVKNEGTEALPAGTVLGTETDNSNGGQVEGANGTGGDQS